VSALVELRGVSKWYGAVIGVNEVDLELPAGITGLLGPNGAGKSTLIKLIAGLLCPSLGEVRVMGLRVRSRPEARRVLGYVPESDGFYEEMTCRQFVTAMARLSGLAAAQAHRRAGEVLEEVGMAPFAAKRLGAASKGMRQRIKLAQALVHDPQVLVLDEPLTGIDPTGREDLMALFRRLGGSGKTVLVSTHILNEVEEITDRIVLLARGRVLAAGTVGNIRDLLDQHPLTVRISSSGARRLARALIGREEVVEVAVGEEGEDLVVKLRNPERFFRSLPALVLEEGSEVDRVEPLDASAEAIFDYLVAGRRGGGQA
jgi:ABC-2 type transport system ATP-binding protein